jgi:glycosyltransferase involved in cell wall biosynthesis
MDSITDIDPLLSYHFKGSVGKLLRTVFQKSDHFLSDSISENPFKRATFNFADSLVFGSLVDPLMTSETLLSSFPQEIAKTPNFVAFCKKINALSYEQNKYYENLQKSSIFKTIGKIPYELYRSYNYKKFSKKTGSSVDSLFHPVYSGDLSIFRERMVLNTLYFHAVTSQNTNELRFDLPFYPFFYRSSEFVKSVKVAIKQFLINKPNGIPILILEPHSLLSGEWLTASMKSRKGILFFKNAKTLWQCLGFRSVADLIFSNQFGYIVGDLYLNKDCLKPVSGSNKESYETFILSDHPLYLSRKINLTNAIKKYVEDSDSKNFQEGCESQRWLYQLGVCLTQEMDERKYGYSYALELNRIQSNKSWFAKYKEALPDHYETHSSRNNLTKDLLGSNLLKRAKRRPLIKNGKIRIAHVVPQIVDGGHAPSKLLRTLVDQANHQQFEVSVICHESEVLRKKMYPRDDLCSKRTIERAPNTLENWKKTGVSVYISNAEEDYIGTAYEVGNHLSEQKIDVIACHGFNSINQVIPIVCDVPKRIFVEHSGYPVMPEFDLVLTSLEGNAKKQKDVFDKIGTKIADLPYGVDCRKDWLNHPPDFGASPQVRMLTTISNHLENRVSGKFADTIAKILQKVPTAVYMPIGPVEDIPSFKDRFKSYGVQNRVVCLNRQTIPSQMCRGMHVYLNEFPFGSGISMLDAMASGIPVVTMYDEKGVMQARNGGNYMGLDHAIQSLDPEDYIQLAVKLITEDRFYEKWKEHALKRYDLFGPKRYIDNFEKLVSSLLS